MTICPDGDDSATIDSSRVSLAERSGRTDAEAVRNPMWVPRRINAATKLGIRLPESLSGDHRPWHAVVSSRLGRNPLCHQVELATVYRWIQQAVDDGALPIVAPSTAAHPWVTRACRLIGVPAIELGLVAEGAEKSASSLCGNPSSFPHESRPGHWLSCKNATVSPDHVSVMLADRLDVAMVRRGGTIHRLVLQRLAEDNAPVVRVLVPVEPWGQPVLPGSARVIHELIDAGAVGYCCHWERRKPATADASPPMSSLIAPSAASLLSTPDRWLVHCTRGRQGAWPGQSDEQFRDSLLLSVPEGADSSPLATLLRIVSQRQLIGSGRTVRCRRPVVCFSDLPILNVIQSRAFRQHLGRWDAEPYGIIVDKQAAGELGAMPVVYVDTAHKPKERLIHRDPVAGGDPTPIDDWRLQARGTTVDWTQQREWRSPGSIDLRKLSPHQAIVFVANDSEIERFAASPWPVISIETLQRFSSEGVAMTAAFR